jgi:hypothetical protein
MKRLLAGVGLALLFVAAWSFGGLLTPSPASQQLTPAALARLEPELCKEAPWTILLTAIVPVLPESRTQGQQVEQIALIDQYKGTGWRKIWVLRIPAAYVTHRTCDSGRKNWTGEGADDLSVSQYYELSLIVTPNAATAATLASDETKAIGIPVTVSLTNRVRDPDKRHRTYRHRSFVNNTYKDTDPPKCREEDTGFGLVRFKRIDPNRAGGVHCGSRSGEGTIWESAIYGRKIGDMVYEFVVQCSVNCRAYTDYKGWSVELAFPHAQIAHWERMVKGVTDLLDRHTAHIEPDDPNAQR